MVDVRNLFDNSRKIKRTSNKMQELAKKDNQSVGDFSGMKSSIKDEGQTISDAYMHEGL